MWYPVGVGKKAGGMVSFDFAFDVRICLEFIFTSLGTGTSGKGTFSGSGAGSILGEGIGT